MNKHWAGLLRLGIILSGCVGAFPFYPVLAEVIPDNTLPNNSRVTMADNTIDIQGGTQPIGSNNLFHSFKEFSVPNGFTAHFNNTAGIENIITRVTGNSLSKIDGILKTNGTANLFLINPHGIVFGANASLQINGSFIASTASSIIFDHNTQFSATNPQAPPLLQVSVPVGLQFGSNVTPIYNEPPVNQPISLQVGVGKTLALVGGDINLEGVNLRAESGRIELGSVGANSLVRLNAQESWGLNYQNVQNFQDIQLLPSRLNGTIASLVNTSGNNITLSGASGSIHLRGNLVKLSGRANLRSVNFSEEKRGNIELYGRKIISVNGSQVNTVTFGTGASGNLILKASESVELIGSSEGFLTGFFTGTVNTGNTGDISIETPILRIKDGARVAAGIATSNINFDDFNNTLIKPESSGAGNITVQADIVEITGFSKGVLSGIGSELSALAENRNAGRIDITTKELIVREGGRISVESRLEPEIFSNLDASQVGISGELNVNARSVMLDNQAQLTAESEIGQGGSIKLNVQDLLLMRNGSQITANVVRERGNSNSGNITINAPNGFIVSNPLENNDITAVDLYGSGGQITINAQSIFGFVLRTPSELVRLLGTESTSTEILPTNDITAFSQQPVKIITTNIDPSQGLSELTKKIVDASGQIDRGCGIHGSSPKSNFTFSGKGGFTSNPLEFLTSEGTLTNWIVVKDDLAVQKGAEVLQSNIAVKDKQNGNFVNARESIVEAQSWVVDANGKVVLVAQASNVDPNSPGFTSASCSQFPSAS